MTTLIEQEVTKVAQRIVDKPPVASGARPSFFRCLCAEASRGGQNSYKLAAYELTRHLSELVEDVDDIDHLIDLVDADDDDDAVIGWFVTHLPRCMALVPKRRRDQFLLGVLAFHDDHVIGEW